MSYLRSAFNNLMFTVSRHMDVPSIIPAFLHVQGHFRNQQRIVGSVFMDFFNLCRPRSYACIVSSCEDISAAATAKMGMWQITALICFQEMCCLRRDSRVLVASRYLHIERCLLFL